MKGERMDSHGAAVTEREMVAAIGHITTVGTRTDDPALPRQVAVLERLCAARGWRLAELVRTVGPVRGRCLGRPAVRYAIDRLEAGEASCLAVVDLNGLCNSIRDVMDLLDALEHADATLVALRPQIDTGTPAGLLAARVLCAFGAWERSQHAERSRRALAAAREKGSLPAAIDPDLKRRIARMRAVGMTLQAIAGELNESGVPTVRGGVMWRPSSVQAALGYKRPPRT
jgi:DNA invertase Pin-like site-specific DNA recombinase